MTVIRPNSVSGITSITAQANEINFFRSNGALAGLQLNGVNFNTTTGVSTFNNLDVGGVLTYQDVTNVDSLGIGTFRTGINVSGGQLDVGSNIKLGNAGVITATSFVGSGANLTGINADLVNDSSPQLGGDLDTNSHNILLDDDHYIKFGDSSDLTIRHTGGANAINAAAGQYLYINSDNLRLNTKTGSEKYITGTVNGAVEIYHDNSKKIETTSAGGTLTGDFTFTGNIYGGNHITIQDSDGASDMLKIGASEDIRIYHYNNNSYIRQHTDLPLIIGGTSTGQSLYLQPKAGEDSAIFKPDGAVELYHDGTKVVETHGSGLTFNQGSGNLIKYGTTSEFPNAAINIYRGGNGYANIRLSSNYGCGLYLAGANNNTDEFSINQDNQKNGYVDNRGGFISFNTGSSGTQRMKIENSAQITFMGDALPSSNNNYDIGSSSNRWRNIYTNDLNLSNKGTTNSVDNTWGDYTIQEGESDLFLINNRSGKKYKFNLTEVS